MHKQRLGIITAAVAGMTGTFLPWFTAPIVGHIRGTKGDGWITLIMFALALMVTVIGSRKNPLNTVQLITAAILGGGAGVVGMWKIISIKMKIKDISDNEAISQALDSLTSIGAGLYVIAIAGVAVVFFAFVFKKGAAQETPPQDSPPL